MTLRPPRMNSSKARENALDYEIAQEQAAALGRLGRALEAALAALSDHDGGTPIPATAPARAPAGAGPGRLLRDASNALWCFVVQREACGLRDQRRLCANIAFPPRCNTAWALSAVATALGAA